MNKEIKIRSHIYVAKSILKRFSYKDKNNHNVIDYLDTLSDKMFTGVSISEFNRKLGYYTTSNEQRLKKICEEKIGMVIKKIETCMNSNDLLNLDDNDIKVLKLYLVYQWIRGDYIHKRIIKDFGLNMDLNTQKCND